jgi:hypothetical protein
MTIDQRRSGAAVTVDGAATYITDRFIVQDFSDAVLSAQQITDAPAGFVNSLRVTVTTADASLGATQGARVNQRIEGFNIADFAWGTANAQPVTLSFWVKSSLTGTFGGSLQTETGVRAYPYTYTINSVNTWEYKTITIVGDTSGTWNTTNGVGVIVQWGLGMGSSFSGTPGAWATGDFLSATGAVSVVGTLNATFQITGVQLEEGTSASPFENRLYGTEFQLCQRYYETGTGYQNVRNPSIADNNPFTVLTGTNFQVTKRANPTISLVGGTASGCYTNSGNTVNINTQSFAQVLLCATGGAQANMSITQPWTASIEL